MIKAEKINHEGEARIFIFTEYNEENIRIIKKISGAKWSQTRKAWHVPYSRASFDALIKSFPDMDYPGKDSVKREESISKKDKTNMVGIEVLKSIIILKLRRNELDLAFIKTLRFHKWNPGTFCWEISNYGSNLELIRLYFGDRLYALKIRDDNSKEGTLKKSNPPGVITVIKKQNRTFRIIAPYHVKLLKGLKTLPYLRWEQENRWWTTPSSEKSLSILQAIASENGLHFKYIESKGEPIVPRKSKHSIVNYRECPREFIEKLDRLNYSESTKKNYISHFEEFINYYYTEEIDKINYQQIQAFQRYLIMDRHVSTSYINLSINAIKFYYERVLGGTRMTYKMDRPKKEKQLPAVLSKEEIVALVGVIKNIKHRALVLFTYSSGLRISEVLEVQVEDLDWDRMRIRVRSGKGKKDREAKLAANFRKAFDSYIKIYKPVNYLFEGVKGEKYSGESFRAVLRNAAYKAGIGKNVTPHTLRHSYATHSMDEGASIRYIQETLGHANIKTTQIYTHLTKKGFDDHKSPLDNMDI